MESNALTELIQEYKKMASICHNIDYADKKSVKANNKAVKRMYEIVYLIEKGFGIDGAIKFKELLNFAEKRTDLWAAVQMLEKMKVDKACEQKALKIIKEEAKNSLGMEYWLKNYLEKR